MSSLWEALGELTVQQQLCFGFALLIAFAFEFINGFHDTANAVTTVIYTGTLKPMPAVIYSGFCNFLGVLLGGTAVAFAIVNLLPVDVLIESSTIRSVVMVISLLLAGVIWNLGTWWYGLPVSSSHTLIGSILGVGLANSLIAHGDASGVNWNKAVEVALALLISPILGFCCAAGLLLLMKRVVPSPKLYEPPVEGDTPPTWIRWTLLATCGGVSLAHGSNDGQKGMGLILLVLIGFLPTHYALNIHHTKLAQEVASAATSVTQIVEQESSEVAEAIQPDMQTITSALQGKTTFAQVAPADRWAVRQAIFRFRRTLEKSNLSHETRRALAKDDGEFAKAVEFVPYWVVVGVALSLGVGTAIGYKRIVVTVAEKIGKTHLTYAQGAAAEVVAAATIGLADFAHMPVSTTHVLSSGVAGTMAANRSGLRGDTIRKIGLAWVMTLPAAILLSASMFWAGCQLVPAARPSAAKSSASPPSAPETPALRVSHTE